MDDLYDEDIMMWNAYFLIVGEITVKELIEREEDLVFPFDPVDYDSKDIQEVIDWFATRDKFEECIELRNKQITLK